MSENERNELSLAIEGYGQHGFSAEHHRRKMQAALNLSGYPQKVDDLRLELDGLCGVNSLLTEENNCLRAELDKANATANENAMTAVRMGEENNRLRAENEALRKCAAVEFTGNCKLLEAIEFCLGDNSMGQDITHILGNVKACILRRASFTPADPNKIPPKWEGSPK